MYCGGGVQKVILFVAEGVHVSIEVVLRARNRGTQEDLGDLGCKGQVVVLFLVTESVNDESCAL